MRDLALAEPPGWERFSQDLLENVDCVTLSRKRESVRRHRSGAAWMPWDADRQRFAGLGIDRKMGQRPSFPVGYQSDNFSALCEIAKTRYIDSGVPVWMGQSL